MNPCNCPEHKEVIDKLLDEIKSRNRVIIELEDKLYHESRKAPEVEYLLNDKLLAKEKELELEVSNNYAYIIKNQKQEEIILELEEVLEKVKHNGCCLVCGAQCHVCDAHDAHKALTSLKSYRDTQGIIPEVK